jgi:hypothetical protein
MSRAATWTVSDPSMNDFDQSTAATVDFGSVWKPGERLTVYGVNDSSIRYSC